MNKRLMILGIIIAVGLGLFIGFMMTGYAPGEENFDLTLKINSTDFRTNDTYQNFSLLVSPFGPELQEMYYNLSVSKNGAKKKFFNEFFIEDIYSSSDCYSQDIVYKNGLFYVFGTCKNIVDLDSSYDIFIYVLNEKGRFLDSFVYDSIDGNRKNDDFFEIGFVADSGEIYLINNYYSSFNRQDYELVKFNDLGQVINIFNFSNNKVLEFEDVLFSEDYFYLVSKKYDELEVGYNPFIQKINLMGDVILNKTFTGISKGGFLGIERVDENDFFAYGALENNFSDMRFFSYRLDSNLGNSSYYTIKEDMDTKYFRSVAFDDADNFYAVFSNGDGFNLAKYSLEGERIFLHSIEPTEIYYPYLFFDAGNIYLSGFFAYGNEYDSNYREDFVLRKYDLGGGLLNELSFKNIERDSSYTESISSSLFANGNLYLLWNSLDFQNLIFILQDNVIFGPFVSDEFNVYLDGEKYLNLFDVFSFETLSNDFYEFEVSGIGLIENFSKKTISFLVRDDLFEIVSLGDLNFPINEWGEFKYKIKCLLGNCSKIVSNILIEGDFGNIVSFSNDAFTKASYPECIVDGSCDCINENVCLAKSLFPPVNIVTQGIPESPTCETDGVYWSVGECSSSAGFGNFCDLMNGIDSEKEFISRDYCIYVIGTDKYYNIKFNEIGLGFSSDPNYLMSYVRELYEGQIIQPLSFDLSSENSNELEFYFNYSLSEIYDVGEGEVEVVIPVYSNQVLEKNFSISAIIKDKPTISEKNLFTITFFNSSNETEKPNVSIDNTSSRSGGGGVYIISGEDFALNFSRTSFSLMKGEEINVPFIISNDGDLEYKLNVYFNGVADFVFDDVLTLDLKRGLNKYSFDLVAFDSIVKGDYEGEIVFGAPLVESVNFSVSLFEEILSNQTKEEKEKKIVVKKGGSSSGSFIEFPVRIGYFDKNEYLNEKMKIDYSIVDDEGNSVYESNSSFIAGDDFDYNVDLKAPSDLESGEYKVNTRIKTPDNYEIVGEHTLVIEEEGDKEIPFWPSFITVFIVVFLAGLLWWLLTKDKDEDKKVGMDS